MSVTSYEPVTGEVVNQDSSQEQFRVMMMVTDSTYTFGSNVVCRKCTEFISMIGICLGRDTTNCFHVYCVGLKEKKLPVLNKSSPFSTLLARSKWITDHNANVECFTTPMCCVCCNFIEDFYYRNRDTGDTFHPNCLVQYQNSTSPKPTYEFRNASQIFKKPENSNMKDNVSELTTDKKRKLN